MHIGYLAAIVAASNAGGAGSVVGDTTTTMMWIDGVSPLVVLDAYIAAAVALVVCGVPAAIQQQRYAPIVKDAKVAHRIDWARLAIVAIILVAAIGANVLANLRFPAVLDQFPVIGAAVWVAILVTALLAPAGLEAPARRLQGLGLPARARHHRLHDARGEAAARLLAEHAFARLHLGGIRQHPAHRPRAASQGGYDWGLLAFAVGYGGSMIWFGSSAGVAISNMYPEAKSVGRWVRHGWHVALAYVIGFAVFMAVIGWHPTDKRGRALIERAAGRRRGVAVGSVIVAAVAFAATDVDDLFLLVAWFAAGRYRARDIVLGQYLGIGTLFAVGLVAALLAWAVPPRLLAWLGVLPVLLGLAMLVRREREEKPVPPATGVLAVAGVTIANGADNLGVYIPLFATSTGRDLAVMGAVFAVMTALWCAAARWLVRHPAAGVTVRRYGPTAVPYVLIGIGLWILLR